jgi:hypothetical protein
MRNGIESRSKIHIFQFTDFQHYWSWVRQVRGCAKVHFSGNQRVFRTHVHTHTHTHTRFIFWVSNLFLEVDFHGHSDFGQIWSSTHFLAVFSAIIKIFMIFIMRINDVLTGWNLTRWYQKFQSLVKFGRH